MVAIAEMLVVKWLVVKIVKISVEKAVLMMMVKYYDD